VEPDIRNRVALLRPPGVVGLSASEDETPVDGPYPLVFEDGEMCNELGVQFSSHVLSADDGSVVGCIAVVVPLNLWMVDLVQSRSQ
jgi:hypothetical protein